MAEAEEPVEEPIPAEEEAEEAAADDEGDEEGGEDCQLSPAGATVDGNLRRHDVPIALLLRAYSFLRRNERPKIQANRRLQARLVFAYVPVVEPPKHRA